MHSTLRQVEEPRFDDDPHDAPMIAPEVVPTAWVDRGPSLPANDATSRERLFAEIRSAAETAAPAVDATFRATDVHDTPARKNKPKARTWMKRALTAFVFALVSAIAAAAWKHHGDAATQTMANWVPLSGVSSPPASESSSATEQADTTSTPAAEQPANATQQTQTTSNATAPAVDADQQVQSMARDLAAMGQQIVELKASIDQLKASQQAMTASPAPAVRAAAPKPPPKVSALPPRPTPAPAPFHASRQISTTAQAAAVPPPPAVAPPPGVYQPPSQATIQPNGEPVMRPPAPLPLLPDRQ